MKTVGRCRGGDVWALVLALVLCGPVAAPAQSLFAATDGARAPLLGTGGSPLAPRAQGALLGKPPTPLVQARALALTDADGLATRRASGSMRAVPVLRAYRPPSARAVRREARILRNRPPRSFASETDLMCIAVSIYHEARNQPRSGQSAVATVILNRAANPERWGMTPCDVVAPVQFSYLTPSRGFAPIRDLRSWALAVDLAAEALIRGPDPGLLGADHYHATYVDPPWNRAMDRIMRIDDHIFWRSRPKPS